jgi:F-box domain
MFDLETAVALLTRIEALNAWLRTKCPASWMRPTTDEILSLPAVLERKSRLEVLPPEILLEILSYLPLGSQACMDVCSRTVSKKIGIGSWIILQK